MADNTDNNDDFWSPPVYFPQRSTQSAVQPVKSTTPSKNTKPSLIKKFSHKLNPVHNKDPYAKMPALSEEQITQVGPKDPPVSPYPLLRLSMQIQGANGMVPPGIYLLKPAQRQGDSASSESLRDSLTVTLTQRGKALFNVKLTAKPNQDENLEKEGTSSPLSKTDPSLPQRMQAEAVISADLKSLVIRIEQQGRIFESQPFPVATDQRPVLSY